MVAVSCKDVLAGDQRSVMLVCILLYIAASVQQWL